MSSSFQPLVLCYHAVSPTWSHALSVDPVELERTVRRLLRRGFAPAAVDAVAGGSGRLLHVTFDDAYRSVLDALPVLARLGVPATVFACSDFARDGRALDVPELAGEVRRSPGELATLTFAELTALAEEGVEVGSHTVSHPRLTRCGDAELRRELVESRERIEDALGRRCRYLAYPYGDEDGRVHAAARAAGYDAAFALPGDDTRWHSWRLPRVGIYRGDSRLRLRVKTTAATRRPATAALRLGGRRA